MSGASTPLAQGDDSPSGSISERREDGGILPEGRAPLKLDLDKLKGTPELRTTPIPRGPDAPSLNATHANPPPVFDSPVATAPIATGRLGRSGTLLGKKEKKEKSSGPKQPVRRSSEAGYEGGVERHGQPNDFVDASSDEDADDSDDAAAKPMPKAKGGPRNSPGLTAETIKAALGEDYAYSLKRNTNPSRSSHQHPRLPTHSRSSSFSRPEMRERSASVMSTRSTEATSHPFPHFGKKNQPSQAEQAEQAQWKSVEEKRLDEDERKEKHWKRWGPYVSERQWVR